MVRRLAKALVSVRLTIRNPDVTHTLFAPTDEAFEVMSEEELEGLLGDQAALFDFVHAHMALEPLSSEALREEATSGDGLLRSVGAPGLLRVTLEDGRLKLENATIIETDIPANESVIHVVDAVVEPAET